MKRMAKAKEKIIHPYPSSPYFRKDFTFKEETKQKRIPKTSKTSRAAIRKPEAECRAILLEEAASTSRAKKTTAQKNKSPPPKRALASFFLIDFNRFADYFKRLH
jgi:hypothetical protein